VLEHLGHAELFVLGVADLVPQRPAALPQPGVELGEAAEALLGRVDPDAPPAVLHVLLDDSLLPPASVNVLCSPADTTSAPSRLAASSVAKRASGSAVSMRETANRLFGSSYHWSVLGAGRHQMSLLTLAAIQGANVRVGRQHLHGPQDAAASASVCAGWNCRKSGARAPNRSCAFARYSSRLRTAPRSPTHASGLDAAALGRVRAGGLSSDC
jgi:hypothetical protein